MASNGIQLAKLRGLLSPSEPQKSMQAVKTTGSFNNNFHLQKKILGHASEFTFKNGVKPSKGTQIFTASRSEQDLLTFTLEVFSYFFLSQLRDMKIYYIFIILYYIHISFQSSC